MALDSELQAAIGAATAAGAMLREEFLRPGGPRGEGDHADADIIAERCIHGILTAAFPGYGYLGEELGRLRPPDEHGRIWVVDPNDGTTAYLEGYRGPSVSIGLLQQQRPVLGVVLAYCAPESGSDLFAWGEGCGPVTRNGRPVYREWPSIASPDCTVLVYHHSDRQPDLRARVLHPMRMRAIPSIAYRLALVAAGDADLAISLAGPVNGPTSWDYGAGHALLIGAGANLYDRKGNVVRYEADGSSAADGCFGGPLPLLEHVIESRRRTQAPATRTNTSALVEPLRGRVIDDDGLLARAQGCLLGQLAGDSLGSLVEFRSKDSIAAEFPNGVHNLADGGVWSILAGQPTDDSEMALALARSMIASGGYDADRAFQSYIDWYKSDPFDVGNTIRAALSGRGRNHDSQANGALMRASPLGILGAAREDAVILEAAARDAELTHPHPVCRRANIIFVSSIAFAIRTGADARAIVDHANALGLSELEKPGDFSTHSGWVLVALHNAFHQLLHARDFESGVVDTVMQGGDTDTNAAVAGALLGAYRGIHAIPRQWLNRVLTARPLAGLPGVVHPRPAAYWAVDALTLAEKLLLTGR